MIRTISIELSKQLKEAGFPQKYAAKYWHTNKHGHTPVYTTFASNHFSITDVEIFASPSAEEILERLPLFMDTGDSGGRGRLVIEKGISSWTVGYINDGGRFNRSAEAISEAAGKMWIYLKENNLLES